MVGATGIEPVTPAVSRQCSTAELRSHKLDFLSFFNLMSQLRHTKEKKWQVLEKEMEDGTFK